MHRSYWRNSRTDKTAIRKCKTTSIVKDATQRTFKLLLIIDIVLQMPWSSGLEMYMILACFQPLLWVMIFEMEAFWDERKSSLKESQQYLLVYLGILPTFFCPIWWKNMRMDGKTSLKNSLAFTCPWPG